jgi:hypothetical protein
MSRPSVHGLGLGALDHEDVLDRRGLRGGLVGVLLHRRRLAPAELPVGGDEQLRLGVLDARLEGARREPAEHHAVQSAEPGAGQHREHGLGDHRHLDGHAVTRADPELGQGVRRLADLALQVGVGDGAGVAGLTLPVERHLLAVAGLDVAVDAVVGDVQPAADEPLRERGVPVDHPLPLLLPVQALGLLGPERLAVGVGALVPLRGGVGLRGELLARREGPVLGVQVVQRGAGRCPA